MHSILQIIDSTDYPADGPELISLADLKAELEITGTDQDVLLSIRITRESNLIAEYCGRRFGFAHAIETFTLDLYETLLTRQALLLSLYPVIEIESVIAGGAELDASTYSCDLASGQLWLTGGVFWSGDIVVRYSGGFELPEGAPARLVLAVIESIRKRLSSSSSDSSSIRSVAHGDTRVDYFQQTSSSSGLLSSSVIDLIKPYCRPTLV